jgi:hypothetical protein
MFKVGEYVRVKTIIELRKLPTYKGRSCDGLVFTNGILISEMVEVCGKILPIYEVSDHGTNGLVYVFVRPTIKQYQFSHDWLELLPVDPLHRAEKEIRIEIWGTRN